MRFIEVMYETPNGGAKKQMLINTEYIQCVNMRLGGKAKIVFADDSTLKVEQSYYYIRDELIRKG